MLSKLIFSLRGKCYLVMIKDVCRILGPFAKFWNYSDRHFQTISSKRNNQCLCSLLKRFYPSARLFSVSTRISRRCRTLLPAYSKYLYFSVCQLRALACWLSCFKLQSMKIFLNGHTPVLITKRYSNSPMSVSGALQNWEGGQTKLFTISRIFFGKYGNI